MAKSSTHGVRYIGLATIDDSGALLKGQDLAIMAFISLMVKVKVQLQLILLD